MKAPSRPIGTCSSAMKWLWYMCEPALRTVNS